MRARQPGGDRGEEGRGALLFSFYQWTVNWRTFTPSVTMTGRRASVFFYYKCH